MEVHKSVLYKLGLKEPAFSTFLVLYRRQCQRILAQRARLQEAVLGLDMIKSKATIK